MEISPDVLGLALLAAAAAVFLVMRKLGL